MTAEGYKTFINGSVMASFMEGIVASILEEKSGAGYGTNCSQLNTVISVIEAMYLCEGMWLFPFCAEDRFFNQPSCIYARAKPRRAKYTHRTKLRFVLCVFRDCIEPSAAACRRIWREPCTDEIACNFRSRSARLMPDTAISS